MTKLRQYRLVLMRLTAVIVLMILFSRGVAQKNYSLNYLAVDKSQEELFRLFPFESKFVNKLSCSNYVYQLLRQLRSKGFATASIDSSFFDSASATIKIFIGKKYQWTYVTIFGADKKMLSETGWADKLFINQPLDFDKVNFWQERFLNYLENNGYPFAKVELDSIKLDNEKIYANMKIDKSYLYTIDSLRVFGNVNISRDFLKKYLSFPDKSIYRKNRLEQISKRISELPYLQETKAPDINYLSSGSILNLYLAPKKSSQVNALIGLLPANQQSGKLLLTADVNLNLKNSFGYGETIGLIWQQFQPKSPRLNLLYQHPYIFNSPFGLDFMFELYSKDTSFINISTRIGAQYVVSGKQSG
ncbi:MAG: hypothetical protein ABUT20_56335, partial [Bacteroidota bacterium]